MVSALLGLASGAVGNQLGLLERKKDLPDSESRIRSGGQDWELM